MTVLPAPPGLEDAVHAELHRLDLPPDLNSDRQSFKAVSTYAGPVEPSDEDLKLIADRLVKRAWGMVQSNATNWKPVSYLEVTVDASSETRCEDEGGTGVNVYESDQLCYRLKLTVGFIESV